MSNNHLTYFKVENFKKFDSLEVKDIGQFNLVVGDNNVGKTCFLEALLFDEDPNQLLSNFWLGLKKRGLVFQIEEITTKIGNKSTTETIFPKENYFKEYIFGEFADGLTIQNNLNSILIATSGSNFNNKYFISINNSLINIYDYDENILNFPLISFNDTPLEEESRSIYENLKTKKEKELLISVLKVINPTIIDIELRENFEDLKSVFLISFEDKDEFVPLNFLGDGFKRIFYIVLKALSLKGKRLLIDEIEIGIHHSKMKDFWVNILKICKELDIQLFATTHSQECIEDYAQAIEVVDSKDEARMILLQEYEKELYATTIFFRHIKAGLNANHKMLG